MNVVTHLRIAQEKSDLLFRINPEPWAFVALTEKEFFALEENFHLNLYPVISPKLNCLNNPKNEEWYMCFADQDKAILYFMYDIKHTLVDSLGIFQHMGWGDCYVASYTFPEIRNFFNTK